MDMDYIERISESTWVDYYDAELYSLESEHPCIANDIIYYIITQAIYNLDVSEESKDKLIDNIYCNCLDSWIDIDADKFPKKERGRIQDFIDQF